MLWRNRDSAMRVVYEAENIIDAHLVKGVLEQAGLPVYIRGEYLTGAIGELPVFGLVAVCVPTLCVAEAAQVLEHFRRERDATVVALHDDEDWINDGPLTPGQSTEGWIGA